MRSSPSSKPRRTWYGLNGELNGITQKIGELHGSDPGTLADARALYQKALKAREQAENLRITVLVTAQQAAETGKVQYSEAKRASVILFLFGWFLNLYGLFSGKEVRAGEPA